MGISYIGYKAFDKDLKCHNDFQYEIGNSYEIGAKPILCERGFHYCDNLIDIFCCYYSDCRICVVKAYGDIDSENSKSCTNKIQILDEIEISKENRIRYVYANKYRLSYEETRELLSEPFDLNKYINDADWYVRKAVADQGYGPDILINDKNPYVRAAVARQGYGLDILINDKNPYVKAAVAKQGYDLNKLINDENWQVRIAVARQGYGLDILINDEDPYVRAAVAEQGYGLDKLINDEAWQVRTAVARQGYRLDILINDKDGFVRKIAQRKMKGLE